MINNFVEILTKPTSFFKSVKHWSYTDVLKYLFIILFLPYLLYFYISTAVEDGFTILVFIISLLISLLSVLVSPFVSSLVTHIGVLILGGKGYKKTFLATANSLSIAAPYLIVSALILLSALRTDEITFAILTIVTLIIMFISWVHALVTEIIGLKIVHKFDTFKAIVAALVIPLAITVLLVIFVAFIVLIAVLLFGLVLF